MDTNTMKEKVEKLSAKTKEHIREIGKDQVRMRTDAVSLAVGTTVGIGAGVIAGASVLKCLAGGLVGGLVGVVVSEIYQAQEETFQQQLDSLFKQVDNLKDKKGVVLDAELVTGESK